MHAKTVALAAAAATFFSAVAATEPARPRIYFPRHVKRQFTNATITSNEAFPPARTTTSTEETTTTKRGGLDDFLTSLRDGLIGGGRPSESSDAPTTGAPSPEPETDEPRVTTIVISSTIIVTPSEAPPAGAASTGGLPPVIVQPTDSPEVPPTEAPPATTETESSSSSSGILLLPTGIIRPTSNILTELLPTELIPTQLLPPVPTTSSESVTSVNATETVPSPTETAPPPEETVPPVEETTTAPPPEEPTPTPSNPLDPILSIITSILPPIPTELPEPLNTTSIPIDLPPIPEPTITSTPVTDPPVPPTDPPVIGNTTTVEPPPNTVTEPTPTITDVPPTETPTEPPPPPVTNTTITDPPPPPTSTPTGGGIVNTTSTEPTPTVSGDTLLPPTTSFTSIPPEATITNPRESWLPTTIIVEQQTSVSTPTEAFAPTTTAPLPSYLPKVISPEDPSQIVQPDGTTEIQIGFGKGENYQFVVDNPMAAAQIFTLLPRALADAGGFPIDRIKMKRLVPYDTGVTLGYITTLAKLYYPTSMVETLRIDIKIANSALYNHPDELVFNLTMNINPAIDIISGTAAGDGPGKGSGPNPSDPNGDPFAKPEGEQQTPIQQGTAAAIGIGAVGVAAAYGAAMFIIARRYKRKKLAHRRSSSMANSSEMRYTGTGSPALMGGALMSREFSSYGGVAGGRHSHGSGQSGQSGRSGMGNSARTAYISAPVAAENSLGWN